MSNLKLFIMKTYIEQPVRMMCVSELIQEAGGKCMDDGGMFPELFNFEAFLNTLPEKKRKEARAIVELYKRSLTDTETNVMKSSLDLYNMLQGQLTGLAHEEFWLVTINHAAKVISRRRISTGGIDQTTADVRMVMKYALQDNATAIAICHNHPSGNVKPSRQDDALTQNIKKAAEIMRIGLMDHVILSDGNYYSYHDYGKL